MTDRFHRLLSNTIDFNDIADITEDILTAYYENNELEQLLQHRRFLDSISNDIMEEFLETHQIPIKMELKLWPIKINTKQIKYAKIENENCSILYDEQYLIFTEHHQKFNIIPFMGEKIKQCHGTFDPTFGDKILYNKRYVDLDIDNIEYTTLDINLNDVRNTIIPNIEDIIHCVILSNNETKSYKVDVIDEKSFIIIRILLATSIKQLQHELSYPSGGEIRKENNKVLMKIIKDWKQIDSDDKTLMDLNDWLNIMLPKRKITIKFDDPVTIIVK